VVKSKDKEEERKRKQLKWRKVEEELGIIASHQGKPLDNRFCPSLETPCYGQMSRVTI